MSINIKTPNDWKNSSLNQWCDFVEICCLYSKEQFYSVEDSEQIVFGRNERKNKINSLKSHAEEKDRNRLFIEDLFQNFKYRERVFSDLYPFYIEDEALIVKESKDIFADYSLYIFLLLSSNLLFVDRKNLDEITKEFEVCSYKTMKILFPQSYSTKIFGTSRFGDEFKGSLRNRLKKLGELLNTSTTITFNDDDEFDVAGGDAGLDIISYISIDDQPYIPAIFAQCACSKKEWIKKQSEIDYNYWRNIFENIVQYERYMFVPFSMRENNGEFCDKTRILTCLFDRVRIINILSQDAQSKEYYKFLEDFLKEKDLVTATWNLLI